MSTPADEAQEATQRATHRTRGRARTHTREAIDAVGSDSVSASNAAIRARQALELRAQGATLDEVARRCGYAHRSNARRAIAKACAEIAEDTGEEARLMFKASYGPIRQTLHRLACRGDVRAVEALVKLDERECKLFGLDLAPADPALSQHYTKRIILEADDGAPLPTLSILPPADGNGSSNGHDLETGGWGQNGYHPRHPDKLDG